jgi:hypothetical protein
VQRSATWPEAAAVMTVCLLCARWAPVAWAGGDYGWTYEAAWRISQGEVPYRDFFGTLPPLTSYSLAMLLHAGSDSLWYYAAHLYAWWAAALAVGWVLARRCGLNRSLAVWSTMAAAWLSLPADGLGHAYGYAATVLAGCALLLLEHDSAAPSWRWRGAAGVSVGLCLLAKQNVGFVFVVAVPAYLMFHEEARSTPSGLARRLLPFVLGVIAGFAPLLASLSSHAGLQEVLTELFFDASAAKGGLLKTALRGIPRFIPLPSAPRTYWVESCLAALVLAAACWLLLKGRSRHAVSDVPEERFDAALVPFVIYSAALLMVSLVDVPAIRNLQSALVPNGLPSYSSVLVRVAYLVFSGVCLLALVRGWQTRDRRLVRAVGFAGLIAYAHATSHADYLRYSAPVVLPLVAFAASRLYGEHLTRSVLRFTAFLVATVVAVFPTYAKDFEALHRIEAPSAFRGLYTTPTRLGWLATANNEWLPLIADRRTLWLLGGGPHAAYGGLPVPNVASYYEDSYSSRLEPRLFDTWSTNPPECVVLGRFSRAPGARLLRRDTIVAWLNERYVKVWGGDGEESISVWRLRPSRAPG